MYIKYKDVLYHYRNLKECKKIVTWIESKSGDEFYKHLSVWVKIISDDDPNIQDIYEVDFYVTYTDDSETLKHGEPVSRWHINNMGMIYRTPDIEKNEIGLSLLHDSWSKDWIQHDK
ncbi:MAG: hypothetical protein IJD58_12630, partial [Lachnospiraceae bacterium]|nr:hypothetical protein [Lachnospiraceae bacterium]